MPRQVPRRPVICPVCTVQYKVTSGHHTRDPINVVADLIEKKGCQECFLSGRARI